MNQNAAKNHPPENQDASPKRIPEVKFRVGRIDVAIWGNGDYLNATFGLRYQDRDKHWTTAHSFGRNDLPALASAAQFALHLILAEEAKANE
jgi:hypothetical protein